MKFFLLAGVFIVATVHPVYAGYGTIIETDEAIIVEYSGNATDEAGNKPLNAAASLGQATLPAAASTTVTSPVDSVAETSAATLGDAVIKVDNDSASGAANLDLNDDKANTATFVPAKTLPSATASRLQIEGADNVETERTTRVRKIRPAMTQDQVSPGTTKSERRATRSAKDD